MENPYEILKISKTASSDAVSSSHLMALKGNSIENRKKANKAKEILINELTREKVNIHCLNSFDEIIYDIIKDSIKPW